jgi:hypothetical protein
MQADDQDGPRRDVPAVPGGTEYRVPRDERDEFRRDRHQVATRTEHRSRPAKLNAVRNLGCLGSRTSSDPAALSARTFAPHEMKDATELPVWVSSTGLKFDCGCRRDLL